MIFCPKCGFLFDVTNKVESNTNSNSSNDTHNYSCKNCSHSQPIEDGYVLYKKGKTSKTTQLNPNHVKADTYSRKSNYNCVNTSCSSHGKNKALSELIIVKNGFHVTHMCSICDTEQ